MRVLLVTHYYAEHRGGVEIVAGELAGRLARRGHEIVWAASTPAPPTAPRGLSYLPMPASNAAERRLGFPYPVWSPGALWWLGRAVGQADLVHLHDSLYLGNLAASLQARWAGKPVLVTQHVGLVPYRSRLLRHALALANRTIGRSVLSHASQTVFVSPVVRDYFARFIRPRRVPFWLPNGVTREVFHPVPPGERATLRNNLGWPAEQPVCLFVGRFVEKKGLTILHHLARRFAQCRWAFIGWGPENPAAWRLPNVEVRGSVAHSTLADYYRAADLLVLPSVGEGFPLVVQEAMACGTPVLISSETASAMPGIASACFVALPTEDQFASAVQDILADQAVWTAARARAAEFAAEHWDWERCADQYAALYQSLASDGGVAEPSGSPRSLPI